MATEERIAGADLADRIREVLAFAPRASFFAVVAMLERLSSDAVRVGGDGPVSQEALRFRNDPSMGFRSGDITSAELVEVVEGPSPLAERREVVELTTAFLGLTGSVSPLPLYIPAEVAQDLSARPLRRDFLDIFHHRLLSLLYRLWTRYQYAREYLSTGRDAWSPRVLSLSGFDAYDPDGALPLSTGVLLRLTPLLACRARTSRTIELALQVVLGEELHAPGVRIEQFTGDFANLDGAQCMRLSTESAVLGRTSILGGRAPDRAGRFAVHLDLKQGTDATQYMAGGARLSLVRRTVISLLREPLDFDVHAEIRGEAQAGFALTSRSPEPLGRRTWLRGHGSSRRVTVRSVAGESTGARAGNEAQDAAAAVA